MKKDVNKKNQPKKDNKKGKTEVIENISNTENVEVIEDNKDIKKNNSRSGNLLLPLIIITTIIYITYLILTIISIINKQITSNYLELVLFSLFMLCFIIMSIKNKETKNNIIIVVGLLVINLYSLINGYKILNTDSDGHVLNFYNTSITDVYAWRTANSSVDIEEKYEYSDTISEYHIISQNVVAGTATNEINKIILTISLGPNYEKEIIVPSFNGWNYDTVIAYLEDNFLLNVDFKFEKSELPVNTVIFQEGVGTRKRNEKISLTFAINELSPITIIDLKDKTLLFATSWLQKNGYKYELSYEYDETIKKNNVISQNIKNEIANQDEDIIKLVISKGKTIVVPEIDNMNQDELNKWIIANNLKVVYEEQYNDNLPSGDIIESTVKTGDLIEAGSTVNITISKGKLSMISYTNLQDFIVWANKYSITYNINYEYSDTILKDQLISTSHQANETIKTDDTIIITISKGKSINIPNFIGMSKTNISNKCNELKLSCSFQYGGYSETIKKDIATEQSKKNGTIVSEGTNLVITLSSGLYEKVTVPSLVGQTKSNASSNCQKMGITCKYVYETNYSTTAKDTVTKQSKTGIMNKGSTITLTLSLGPAKTYNVVIDPNQLTYANATATKNTLQSKLSAACPGVTFNYIMQKADTGIGYLAQNSQVKVGSNTFVQGQTYNVIINSN